MIGKFIKFLMVAVLLFTATFAIAGPEDLVVTTNEREARLCIHENALLKVFVTDTTGELTTFSYQWYYNTNLVGLVDPSWTPISGATTSILNLSDVSAATTVGNVGYYFCRIYYDETDNTIYRNSEKIHVTVATAIPNIGYVTAANVVCEGAAFDMEAFDVTGQFSMVWYFGEEVISRGNAYHVASASSENAGVYRFVANNACGDSVYGPFEISVTELPRIVTQPRSAALCGGDDLTFRVVATGTDLQYQWYYNNAPYPSENTSATTSSLVIEHANPDPEFYSNTFSVQVSNACATVTSRSVGTIVSDVPNIVGQLESTEVCEGVTVTLSSDATTNFPTDTLTYQWFLNGRPVDGETANIITFDMDSAYMGEYYCEVTNGCGTVSSERADVRVKMPPIVETQPYDVFACAGDPAQLYAKITGYLPIDYTWFKDNGEGLEYTDINDATTGFSGVHTNTLLMNPVGDQHEHFYFCRAVNECGSVLTDTVYVAVTQVVSNVYPLVTSFSACSGIDTMISLDTLIYMGSNTGAIRLDPDDFESEGITFAWHKENETEIVSTESVLYFENISDDDEGRYVCDIMNSCGTFTTPSISVTIKGSPVIVEQPHNLDVCQNGTLSLSISATGDNLTYGWYRNEEYLSSGVVSDNHSSTYTAPAALPQYGGTYYCVVRSTIGCGEQYSDEVTVTVGTNPVITSQPTPAIKSLCEGAVYDLEMTATGEGLHFQWYNEGVALSGQTSENLHIDHVTRGNNGSFYCLVSNACTTVQSEFATLTVNAAPDMTLGPDIHACRGQSVVLAPQGQDEYGHYSWNYGTYGYQPTLTVTLAGSYILEVSDSAHGNCAARDTVRVTFHDYFDIAFDTTPIVTCGEFTLDAGAGAAEYMWSTTDMTNSITVGMSGYYMVTVDGDGYGCTTSAAVDVTIGEEIVINLGDDITAPVDSEVELSVPAVFETYIWNTGYNAANMTVVGSDYGIGSHRFWVEVSTGGCYASDTIYINFIEDGYVNMESMPELNIYPNPASEFVNIVSENGEISDVQVFDLTGRLVFNKQVADESLTLNVSGMADATYFVRVMYTDGKASVSKLIINR